MKLYLLSTFLSILANTVYSNDDESWGTDQCATVACKYKAPNPDTPEAMRRQWHQEDVALWNYVEESVPAVLDHTGSAAFDGELMRWSDPQIFSS